MKRCKNCKAPLDKQATACPQCGTPVRSMKLRHKLLIALAVLLLVIGGIIGALFATGHGDLITGLPARIAAAFSGDANGAGRAGTDGTGGSSGGGATGGGASPSETDFVLLGSGFTDRTIGSEDDARAAVEDAAPALGMEDADAELGTCASNEVMGNSYYRFAQEYEGITVYGRSVVVSADGSGEALGLTSNYAALGDIETEPAIAAEEAEERVIASVDDVQWTMSEGLTIYSLYDTDPFAAWQILVVTGDGAYRYFVSAETGSVVAREVAGNTATGRDLNGDTVRFNTSRQGDGFALVDSERGISAYDAEGEGRTEIYAHITMTGEDGGRVRLAPSAAGGGYVWEIEGHSSATLLVNTMTGQYLIEYEDGTREAIASTSFEYGDHLVTSESDGDWSNAGANTLVDSTATAYDYYLEVLGWESYDGAGGPIHAVYGLPESNAFSWVPTGDYALLAAGGSMPYPGRMVIGHEFTHAVVSATCALSGDETEQAGPLNEAVSDLMGVAISDMNDNGIADNSYDWDIEGTDRNLEDPESSNLPDSVNSRWYWDENLNPQAGSDDDPYEEHHNATVIGHAGYLMCAEGSEAAVVDGDALSTEEMAKLVFVSFFTMPADCTFNEFATIMQNVAQTFCSQGTLTQAQADRVTSAFVNVGLYGYDRALTLEPDATLSVLDVNGEPYGSYTVALEAVYVKGSQTAAELNQSGDMQRTASSTDPLPLDFPAEGVYRMTLTDGANSARSEEFVVSVLARGESSCELQTDFGGVDQASAQAERTRVITGEQDISLVLDVSSSMSGSRIEQLRSAAQGFVDTAFADSSQVRVGMVAYNQDVSVRVPLAVEPGSLESEIASLDASGSTNIELALQTARAQLESGTADRKIIVLMSDGEPTDGAQGDDLIAVASELKEAGFKIYTVGVEQAPGGEELLRAMASDGCYYSVDAESLSAFFAQIATEISGVPYMYVRIECPVEVTVSYNGETLSSAGDNPSTLTSFGSLAFEAVEGQTSSDGTQETVKILRLREGVPYTVEIEGTGMGTMDYVIAFVDEQGDYADFRTFDGIEITNRTQIETVAEYARETLLQVDEDGDGVWDRSYRAGVNENAVLVDNGWAAMVVCAGAVGAFALIVAVRGRSLLRLLKQARR